MVRPRRPLPEARVPEEFARLCVDRGLPALVVSGLRFGEIPEFPGTEVILGGHFAVAVGGPVVARSGSGAGCGAASRRRPRANQVRTAS
jgi:hypothetical protein